MAARLQFCGVVAALAGGGDAGYYDLVDRCYWLVVLVRRLRLAVLAGGGAVVYCDLVDRSTVTAARAKPPTAKTAVSGAT
ncbi:hypothetical protein [Lacticaseibacillus pantheris]|uniref:hypothetical protein n=1 Tax=Lacticaseibacillus pantheris TaxID=171523 RepID=UPI00265A26CA|nr:hypothetical protein [Lacticaseibacillus pantheris]WKF85795.1 hypothetical protein QY874_04220 [Lacticaseibacillus pantheris]